jgi:oligoribonuclease NrnB/cAMP/cGMP phosphodiesterase (DHH superfamily)
MKHYIITRFSILDQSVRIFPSWNTSSPPIKENLFSDKRLDHKFTAFDKITYPSIKNQNYSNYTWLIYASVYLPEFYKDKLKQYADNNIQINYVNNFKEMKKHLKNIFIKEKKEYSSIRLDDDDGLCSSFLDTINSYQNQKNKIISFPNGIRYTIDNNKNILFGSKIVWPKNAMGMTAIGFNIFSAGNHNKVDSKYEVLYDHTENAYFLCCSEFCDTKREFF